MKMRSFDVCQCGAPLQAIDREIPQPQGTEVLLKMLAAGVCLYEVRRQRMAKA